MFIFAIVHKYVFGYHDFKAKMLDTDHTPRNLAYSQEARVSENPANRTIWENTKDLVRLDDVREDANDFLQRTKVNVKEVTIDKISAGRDSDLDSIEVRDVPPGSRD